MHENAGQPEITGTFVTEKLKDCSELSSAELTKRLINGLFEGFIGDRTLTVEFEPMDEEPIAETAAE